MLKALNPDVKYSDQKDSGAWTTRIREFEPQKSNMRPFDSLRNKLRQDKKLPPMPSKSTSKGKDYWGKVITHYQVRKMLKI